MPELKGISVSEILGISEGEKGEKEESGTRSVILSYIRKCPDGVSATLISEALGISDRHARAVLEELNSKREIYKRTIPGIRGSLYYPNGKLIHKYLQESKDFGSQIFRISFHEGNRNPRIQIQERKFGLLEGETVEGSIFVDIQNGENLISFLQDMLNKFNAYGTNKEKGGLK